MIGPGGLLLVVLPPILLSPVSVSVLLVGLQKSYAKEYITELGCEKYWAPLEML